MTTLYEHPEKVNDCVVFLSKHYGNIDCCMDFVKRCAESNDSLPQGCLILNNENIDSDNLAVVGFCGITENAPITRDDLSPFLTFILVDSEMRGQGLGASLLKYARGIAGKLGYFRVYLAIDYIGYCEKNSFREIGLTNFGDGRPTKIYMAPTIGIPKVIDMIVKKYGSRVFAILLGGSYVSNDGFEVQDIDLQVIIDDSAGINNDDVYFTALLSPEFTTPNMMIDITFRYLSQIRDEKLLLADIYESSFLATSVVIYERDSKPADIFYQSGLNGYIRNYRYIYFTEENTKKNLGSLAAKLHENYNKIIDAYKLKELINIHIQFASYTKILCEAVAVKAKIPVCTIRGLQRIGDVDKSIVNKIIELEGHRRLDKNHLMKLMPLYTELWKGYYWEFQKKEIEYMINNNLEPQGFHALNIFFMSGIEKLTDNEKNIELFRKWNRITSECAILPIKSFTKFQLIHNELLKYLEV